MIPLSFAGEQVGWKFSLPIKKNYLGEESKYDPLSEINENLNYDGKIQVLVADDKELNLKVADLLLKHFGVNVTCVRTGELAVEECTKKKFDLVFMDIFMPVMGGVKATELIRQSHEDQLIIGVSAKVSLAERHRYLEAGMNDFIVKPLTHRNLKRCFRKWLGEGA